MTSASSNQDKPSRLATLWAFMKGFRTLYLGAILALLFAVLISYVRPLIIGATIDSVIGDQPPGWPGWVTAPIERLGGTSMLARNLWACGLAIVLLTAASGGFMYLKGRWAASAAEGIARRIRDRLYDQLQSLPLTFHDRHDTGDLVQRCTSDVETIHVFLSLQVTEVGRAIIQVLAVLPIMLYLNVTMTGVSMLLIPVILVGTVIFFLKVRTAFQRSDEAEGRMTARLQENITGIRVVRAFARQDFESRRFAERNAEFRDLDYRLIRLLAWYWSISDYICFAQRGLVLFAGAYIVSRGRMTIGELVIFLWFVDQFLWPIRRMGRTLTDLSKALVSVGRLGDILHESREIDDTDAPTPDLRIEGRVEFRDVHFAFERPAGLTAAQDAPGEDGQPSDSSDHVLRGVSFVAEPGQTVAILGPSGSGKSTIINLLLRLYDYRRGSIRLDDAELRDLDRRAARSQFGVIMQQPFLYSKSLRENIKLARGAASDDEMIEATQIACVHDSVASFEHGYDTVVGERGVTLSGGQRQRVALARAILKDPPVLILDDALSAVDTQTEAMILRALKQRRGRHTTLLIAHRLSTLMHADRILVLDHGRIVQRGTHEQLVTRDGLYRRLWTIQNSLEDDLRDDVEQPAPAS